MTDWYERLPDGWDPAETICNIGWWDEGRLRSLVEHPRVVPVLAPRADGVPCVEVCAGRGANLGLLTAMGATQVVGIDRSPAQLAAAVTATPTPPSLVRGDALALPVGSAAAGLVLCVEAAGHLEDLVQFLDEVARILRIGGTLVLVELLADPVLEHLEPVATDVGLRLAAKVDLTDVIHTSFDRWEDRPHPFGPVFDYLKERRDGWSYHVLAFDRAATSGPVRDAAAGRASPRCPAGGAAHDDAPPRRPARSGSGPVRTRTVVAAAMAAALVAGCGGGRRVDPTRLFRPRPSPWRRTVASSSPRPSPPTAPRWTGRHQQWPSPTSVSRSIRRPPSWPRRVRTTSSWPSERGRSVASWPPGPGSPSLPIPCSTSGPRWARPKASGACWAWP